MILLSLQVNVPLDAAFGYLPKLGFVDITSPFVLTTMSFYSPPRPLLPEDIQIIKYRFMDLSIGLLSLVVLLLCSIGSYASFFQSAVISSSSFLHLPISFHSTASTNFINSLRSHQLPDESADLINFNSQLELSGVFLNFSH